MHKIRITADHVSNIHKAPIELLTQLGYDIKEKPYSSIKSVEEYIDFIKDANGVIIGVEPFDESILKCIPNLRIISRRGVGVDNININYCKEHDILVTRTVGVVESAVSELTMGYILDFARKVKAHSSDMHDNIWKKQLSTGLKGAVLGLVGFGGIAQAVAEKAVVFGMKVIYHCPHPKPDIAEKYKAQYVSFEELLKDSDYISIHTPLNENTENIFNIDTFKQMKPSAVFINTARGGVMKEEDLAQAIREKIISGAAIDVFSKEPCSNSPLMGLDSVILTPHVGTFTRQTFAEMNYMAAENIVKFFNGER